MAHPRKPRDHWAHSITDLYACPVGIGSITGRSPQTIISKGMREMAWCLVLGKYFNKGNTSTEDEAEDTLLK